MICTSQAKALITLSYGYANKPCRGMPPCGDGAAWIAGESVSWLLVMDAIGHGPVAHGITRLTLTSFSELIAQTSNTEIAADAVIRHLHSTLLNRHLDEQAAINLYRFDHIHGTAETVSIGNLVTYVINPKGITTLGSQNGMVGGRIPKTLNVQSLTLQDNTVLAVFSDGINSRDARDELGKYVYGPYSQRALTETARLLVEAFHRTYDDASCGLVRVRRSPI